MKQRRPDGTGYCTTLTANGITGQGQAAGEPHSRFSGTVRPWSTSILLTMVRSKSSWITDCAMCAASSGWPIDRGHRARAPAFVGRRELGRRADGEGRDHLQAEGRGVVVVDEEDHVGPVLLHPLLGELVAPEHRLPVRLAGLAVVDRRADGRHVRGVDGGGDAGHGQAPALRPARCLHERRGPPRLGAGGAPARRRLRRRIDCPRSSGPR